MKQRSCQVLIQSYAAEWSVLQFVADRWEYTMGELVFSSVCYKLDTAFSFDIKNQSKKAISCEVDNYPEGKTMQKSCITASGKLFNLRCVVTLHLRRSPERWLIACPSQSILVGEARKLVASCDGCCALSQVTGRRRPGSIAASAIQCFNAGYQVRALIRR